MTSFARGVLTKSNCVKEDWRFSFSDPSDDLGLEMWRRWAKVFCFLIPVGGIMIERNRHPRDIVGYANGYPMSWTSQAS